MAREHSRYKIHARYGHRNYQTKAAQGRFGEKPLGTVKKNDYQKFRFDTKISIETFEYLVARVSPQLTEISIVYGFFKHSLHLICTLHVMHYVFYSSSVSNFFLFVPSFTRKVHINLNTLNVGQKFGTSPVGISWDRK